MCRRSPELKRCTTVSSRLDGLPAIEAYGCMFETAHSLGYWWAPAQ
ncbi:Hypothetical protein MexAM1_META2p1057 (plasmid) [Methylorubrum extorquens AM1]|uniref:Uncharacterized protein n=1 Tax=Methylorubrum extorquens (strain ATCC 14718 / DSM 1338 / JCM 2805 / NCIMB 9133 / AM1) TaxID=272630 RepID=C5B5V6_METEA|nr:Hypothetical protein MexAM1_META2p1057 [Methylorubrum extorquens AM1]